MAHDLELMRLLSELEAARGYRDVGFAAFAEYAASVLQMPARQARDLVRVARALPALPALQQAMAGGHLGWTKAREIVRVASPDTVDAWVARAQAVSSRELEALVAALSPGERKATCRRRRQRARLGCSTSTLPTEPALMFSERARSRCDIASDHFRRRVSLRSS
jgi:hypothetical protein